MGQPSSGPTGSSWRMGYNCSFQSSCQEESLSRKGSACVAKSIFADREVQQSLKDLHERYVVNYGR